MTLIVNVSELSASLKNELESALESEESVYRLTGDLYFQNDGFMTKTQVEEHIKWWENYDGENHDDMWNCVTFVDAVDY